MSGIATAVVGSAVVSGYVANRSADKAADAQTQSSEAGIAEQRRQFDAVQELLSPYVSRGERASDMQRDLVGLSGPQAQRRIIKMLENSPELRALTRQGEEAILQNASATGGLRGGNVQAALAQFRPQMLSQLIDSQFGKLQQISGLGQASAAGQAAVAQNTGNAISNLLTQQGQARAGAALAQGQAVSGVADSIGQLATLKALKVF